MVIFLSFCFFFFTLFWASFDEVMSFVVCHSGFTDSNYTQLTELYNKYKDKGDLIYPFLRCYQFGFLFILRLYFMKFGTFLSLSLSVRKWLAKTLLLHACLTWFLVSGFEILAFPCNQFLRQEPGTSEAAQDFACTRFKAEYPIFHKVVFLMPLSLCFWEAMPFIFAINYSHFISCLSVIFFK